MFLFVWTQTLGYLFTKLYGVYSLTKAVNAFPTTENIMQNLFSKIFELWLRQH